MQPHSSRERAEGRERESKIVVSEVITIVDIDILL
jgi:hypothetical protein